MKSSKHYLEKIKALEPLDIDAPDRINDPTALSDAIGAPVGYSAAVESETDVSGGIITAILPCLDDPQVEFFDWWDIQERIWHGGAQMRLLSNLGIEPMPSPETKVSETHEKIGAYTARSKVFHDIVEATVMGVMCEGEYETINFYSVLQDICRSVGEDEIADMFKAIKLHEMAHFSYERARAIENLGRIRWPLRYIPGLALKQLYLPVGVDSIGSERSDRFADLLTGIMSSRRRNIEKGLAAQMSFYPGISKNSSFGARLYADIVSARDANAT